MDVAGALEEWRSVVGLEGEYEVSSLGRVWSVPRTDRRGRACGGLMLVAKCAGNRYPRVTLAGRLRYVHCLVAEAFLGPCRAGKEVRHLDGNPMHSAADNLTYGTRVEQWADRRRHGTAEGWRRGTPGQRSTKCSRGHDVTGANIVVPPDGYVICRACRRARAAATKARSRGGPPVDVAAYADEAYRDIRNGTVRKRAPRRMSRSGAA